MAVEESVSAEVDRGMAQVRAAGEFDIASAYRLDHVLGSLTDQGVRNITIDLRDVTFMDSAGLHPIMQFVSLHPGVVVAVVNAQPGVRNLFRLHGVDSLMTDVVV